MALFNIPKNWFYDIVTKTFVSKDGRRITSEQIENYKIYPGGVIPFSVDEEAVRDFIRDEIKTVFEKPRRAVQLEE